MKRDFHAKQPVRRLPAAGRPHQNSNITVARAGNGPEREADRIAEKLVNGGALSQYAYGPLSVSPLPAVTDSGECLEPDLFQQSLTQSGKPLDSDLQSEMNRVFNYDFSSVRVHTGPKAEASARSLHARAFTVGNDIVFNAAQYIPSTRSGRRLLLHELTHVVQQRGRNLLVQRTPISAAEGVAQAAQANPRWRFGRTVEGSGFRMNPAYWRVTYHLRARPGLRAIPNNRQRTALDNVQRFLDGHPSWRQGATAGQGPIIELIEVTLLRSASASAAARDLTAPGSRSRYSFECFTATSLVQFMGRYRSLRSTNPATADTLFDRRYSDIRVRLPYTGSPIVRMGGADVVFNLSHIPEFSLRELLDSSTDMGLQRGDWVYLSNRRFITSGAFQGENAIYLGNKRFFGHGIGVFTPRQYALRLRSGGHTRRSVNYIINQVRVGPRYRPPAQAVSAPAASAPVTAP